MIIFCTANGIEDDDTFYDGNFDDFDKVMEEVPNCSIIKWVSPNLAPPWIGHNLKVLRNGSFSFNFNADLLRTFVQRGELRQLWRWWRWRWWWLALTKIFSGLLFSQQRGGRIATMCCIITTGPGLLSQVVTMMYLMIW